MKQEQIFLGRFVKAFGIRGELKLLASDDFWFEVLESKELFLERAADGDVVRRPVRVEYARPHGGQYVVKLDDVHDRNEAEVEVGAELFVDAATLDVALPDRELPYQVIGALVRTEEGRVLGRVSAVLSSAAQRVYEVTGEDGVVLIPAVPAFVVARSPDGDEITIRPIPGLIDG